MNTFLIDMYQNKFHSHVIEASTNPNPAMYKSKAGTSLRHSTRDGYNRTIMNPCTTTLVLPM